MEDSGHQLFIGVDEYDAPANAALFSSVRNIHEDVVQLFSTRFYAVLKEAVARNIVAKYWITGVLPAFRDGISPLLAVKTLSMSPRFHGICGFTHAEVRTIAETYLSPSLQSHEISAVMHELQQWHNGHRFCEDAIEPLYNPQLVFTRLTHLAMEEVQKPRDELEAIHMNNALYSIGESTFPDIFLSATSSKLVSEIRYEFSSAAVKDPNPESWVSQTLLFFFGVFTFAKRGPFLTIPNKTMRQLVCFTITSEF